MNRLLFVAIGLAVWLLATLVMRAGGHLIFLDDEPAVLYALWLATVLAMFLLAQAIFRWRKLRRAERFEAAALLALPGMLLDALAVEFYASVFPNMPLSAAGSFGAWLLLAYASVLLAAFWPRAES